MKHRETQLIKQAIRELEFNRDGYSFVRVPKPNPIPGAQEGIDILQAVLEEPDALKRREAVEGVIRHIREMEKRGEEWAKEEGRYTFAHTYGLWGAASSLKRWLKGQLHRGPPTRAATETGDTEWSDR
jgi:hypothetical protein